MDRNQAWPGEPPSQLAGTSTHDLFGGGGGGTSSSEHPYQHQQQQYSHHPQHQQQLSSYQTPHPYQHEHQYASEMGAKKAARRNRNALSCAECRRLKLKCSRVWPCTSCVKRKCAHICPDDVLKEVRPSRTKEVGALQSRIRELEQSLAQASGTGVVATGGAPSGSGRRTRQHSPTNASSSIQDEGSYQSYEPYNASGAAGNDSHAPGIQDVAEVMGTLLLGDDGSSRYLGKSAANALFHEDGSDDGEGSAGSQEDDDEIASTFSGRFQPGGFPMVSRGLDVEDFQGMLPPLPDAQRLAHAYYTNCAYMFEPLRRDSFDKYLAAAYNFQMQDPLPLEQLACVFMVMALGVSFDLEAEFRDPASNKYHNIAQACLTNAKFLNVPSLASIQCLHLMSTWQLTTHSQTGAFRAWPLLGLAGRMVLSTGIHRDGSIWAIPDPHLTIRRQLFWELASYDRFQGLILGRPYMLNSKHFDTLMPEGGGSTDSGESIEYHRAKWQFSLLVGELCDECLSVGRPGYDTILLHDRKIRTFKENLPAWLRFDPQAELSQAPPEAGSREFRQMAQRHALVVMIHETLLFLHRVAFANAIENYPAEPLRSPWAQSVVSLCLEAARTLIAVTRCAFHSYSKLAARWWHIQIHCFGAATCLAAVCIKAPASALTRLAWAELCDAVNLLENQIPEGGHARDLAPRLKRLREQAQLKLDAYQQSIISSNYPSVNAGVYDSENRSPHHHNSQSGNTTSMGDSPSEEKPNEDDKLAVLGTATRVLEGKLRQSSRHHHNHNKQFMGSAGGKSTGSSYNSNTPPMSGALSSATTSASTSYPYSASYSPGSFGGLLNQPQGGQMQQQQSQSQLSQTQQQRITAVTSSAHVFSASTPTAQTQPFAMGKGAMPVEIGVVDQSLAELLAEVSTPGRDPTISGGADAGGYLDGDETENEDDSGMMYFNMPSGSTPGATSPLSGGRSPPLQGGADGGNAFSSFSFTTQDGFKAPRNPSISAASPPVPNGPSNKQQPSHSQQSSTSSNYTALPDAGVSPSSGLNFGSQDMGVGVGGMSESGVVRSPSSAANINNSTSNSNNNNASGGASFLSSIPGLLAPSPGVSPYGSYSAPSSSSAQDGRRGSVQSDSGSASQGQGQGPLRTSQNGQQSSQYARNGGGNPEDSYLDTAWMDYFPTPGVGLFPQSTGSLFGGTSASGTSTPGGGPIITPSNMVVQPQQFVLGPVRQGNANTNSNSGDTQRQGQRGSIAFVTDGGGGMYPQQQPQQQGGPVQYQSPPSHQQQQQQQQMQQQQQQRGRYMPQQQQQPNGLHGSGNVNPYRGYDDLFGGSGGNNRY